MQAREEANRPCKGGRQAGDYRTHRIPLHRKRAANQRLYRYESEVVNSASRCTVTVPEPSGHVANRPERRRMMSVLRSKGNRRAGLARLSNRAHAGAAVQVRENHEAFTPG